ncbi:Methionine synthase reductase [Collichthys lucidus]|uniref:Methionine synthase reductase n=1 Tax=Collichthys lucidus TaxID=240159 RepID=A0A4U5VJ33_COLLU|nr:Methionine synthase reductase [Collichthys lucidus]
MPCEVKPRFVLLYGSQKALGDTNYANFCNCGKTIERRLQELGAKQFYATGYADDGVGLEVVVDPWLDGLWKAIKGVLSKMASDRTGYLNGEAGDSPKETPNSSVPDIQLNLLSITDRQNCESVRASTETVLKFASAASDSTTHTAVSDLRPASPTVSPGLSSNSSGAASVSTSGTETQTGDAGVPDVALAALLTRSLPPLSESSLNVPALPPPYLDVSLQEVDTVDQAFLRALVEHTGDGVQRRRLQELCSKQGATDYNLYVRDPSLSLLELLTAFPSCSPPLSLLIEHLPKLQPRPYSAASSCLRHPGKLHFVFNVVEFPACSGRPAGRRGLCTGWLFDLINPVLVFREKAESSGSSALPKCKRLLCKTEGKCGAEYRKIVQRLRKNCENSRH